MADFKKIKINNTTYNVKDEGAGRSLSVSGQDLSLKDGANNILSTVTLPGSGGGTTDVPKFALPSPGYLKYVYNANTKQLLWKRGQGAITITLSNDIELYFGVNENNNVVPYRSNGKKKWVYTDANDTHMLGGAFKMGINSASTPKPYNKYANTGYVDLGEKYIYLVSDSSYVTPYAGASTVRNIRAQGFDTTNIPVTHSNLMTVNHCIVIYDNEVIDTEYDNADFYMRVICNSGTLKITSSSLNQILFDIANPVNNFIFGDNTTIGSQYNYYLSAKDEFNRNICLLSDKLTSLSGSNVLMNLSYFENL
jgi:hypothetical protein